MLLRFFRDGETKQIRLHTTMMALQGIRACLDLICLQINHSKHFLSVGDLHTFQTLLISRFSSVISMPQEDTFFYPLSVGKKYFVLPLSHREVKYPQGGFWFRKKTF